MSTAVVIGGGISGLSSAYYMQKSCKFGKIILLESASRVGGWMQTLSTPEGAKIELGPRSIRTVGTAGLNTLCLAEDLGLSGEVIPVLKSSVAAQNRFVYANKRLNVLPNKFSSLIRTVPPFSKPLIRYAFHELMTPGKPQDDESVYTFISRRFGEDLAMYAVDPLCRGIFAGDCRKLSLKSCFPILHTVESKYGNVIFGLPKMMKQTKGEDQGRICNLAKKQMAEQWASYSFRSGLQQLSDSTRDAIQQSPQVDIAIDTPCTELKFSDGKAMLTVNGEKLEADHVISTIYAQDLASILSENHSPLIMNLNKIPAVDAVVVNLEFDGKMDSHQPGFGHLTPSFENSCVMGVIYDSDAFPQLDRQDRPSTRFTVMMGGSWMDDLKKQVPSMSNNDLGKFAVKSLQSQLKITQEPTSVYVSIQRNCIPQYVLGHSSVLENLFSQVKSDKLPLSLVGSSYKGPSVNDCINNARLEVERITGMSLQ